MATLNVSRETFERMELLHDLLLKWNPKINLVSKSTLETAWQRHIMDSVQIYELSEHPVENWVDIGSGGGFPGLVIALMQSERNSPNSVAMIESDLRKCAFLRTVLRSTGVSGKVITQRIEEAPQQSAQVLSARALADLSTLFSFSERHLAPGGICLFPKGANWKKEVKEAEKAWSFDYEAITSKTNPEAVILKIGELKRV